MGQGNKSPPDTAVEFTIDGLEHPVLISKLPALKAQTLFVKLSRLIGPAIGRLASGMGDEGGAVGLASVRGKEIAGAIDSLVDRLTEEEFEKLRASLLQLTFYGGGPLLPQADAVFQGKTLALWRIMLKALEVNFSDFFAGAGGFVETFRAQLAHLSGTSPTKSNPPGDAGA